MISAHLDSLNGQTGKLGYLTAFPSPELDVKCLPQSVSQVVIYGII